MAQYEYKVVPAPSRGEKARGVKTTADRYALALSNAMNRLGREGWEYLRADSLPCEERVGLTGSKTTFQHMLVFRRPLAEGALAPLVPSTPDAAVPKLGAATDAQEGAAPALGPAKADAPSVVPPGSMAAE